MADKLINLKLIARITARYCAYKTGVLRGGVCSTQKIYFSHNKVTPFRKPFIDFDAPMYQF
jgi:hypothetical protein